MKEHTCPEYDGTNAKHIQLIFLEWLESNKPFAVMRKCATFNLDYWTWEQFAAVQRVVRFTPLNDKLNEFLTLYSDWFGEYPVKPPGKKRDPSRKFIIDLGTYREGVLTDIKKVRITQSFKSGADDRKNGWYYLERQLNGLKLK